MIELSSETQQATTDQWREKTHALTSEMTEMQRGHSEALKAASRAANYDEEALRMVRCRLFWSAFPMFVPSLSWRNDHFYV